MHIPKRVEKGLRTKAEKAVARLRYVMAILAARHTERNSLRNLAEMLGVDHSTISIYVRRGEFSQKAAERIVQKLAEKTGDKTLTASMLTDPLSIPKEPG